MVEHGGDPLSSYIDAAFEERVRTHSEEYIISMRAFTFICTCMSELPLLYCPRR